MSSDVKELIGAYRIVRRLGQGGMGEVFLAFDERLERLVAIKRVRADFSGDAAQGERFRREARTLARLRHPHIVQIHDLLELGEEGDAIVMEYLEGRSLAELLDEGPLDATLAVDLAEQVARGLACAHGEGLLHRDLKGSNVIVDRLGQVRILDFGLAKPLASGFDSTLTGHGQVVGTFRSMSPEQALGEPLAAESDLFSLGVLIYEMLAGSSPFVASGPAEILRKVVAETPRPLREERPGLPSALYELVDDLLEKDPAQRPPGAGQVAQTLQRIATLPELSREAREVSIRQPTPSELDNRPTGFSPPRRSYTRQRSATRPAWFVPLSAASIFAVFLPLLAAGWWFFRPPAATLRLAVPAPVVVSGEASALVVEGVQVEVLRALLTLDGITPIDPTQIGDVEGAAGRIARSVSADQVLTTTITGEGPTNLVSFQRIRAEDGAVIWTSSVAVPKAPEDALVMANAVLSILREAFPDHPLRAGVPDLRARSEDYAEFLKVRQRLEEGKEGWAPELERLAALVESSPRFFDGHVLLAKLALDLLDDTKNPDLLDRARESMGKARELDPDDPALMVAETRLALAEGDWPRAEAAMTQLEVRVPGDPRVPQYRARLAEGQGELGQAVSLLRVSVTKHPTWRNLSLLADFELRLGAIDSARGHWEKTLEMVPGHIWPMTKLGGLELAYGDLQRAEKIYEDLIAANPHRSHLTNLGLVRFLLGDHAGAVASYSRALKLSPGHLATTINLADAELTRGRVERARQLYAESLAALEALESRAALKPVLKMAKAQCLARLGEVHKAVEMVLDTLRESENESEVFYQAALVYALAGEDASALACARKALEMGYNPRWFDFPGFEQLKSDLAAGATDIVD